MALFNSCGLDKIEEDFIEHLNNIDQQNYDPDYYKHDSVFCLDFLIINSVNSICS